MATRVVRGNLPAELAPSVVLSAKTLADVIRLSAPKMLAVLSSGRSAPEDREAAAAAFVDAYNAATTLLHTVEINSPLVVMQDDGTTQTATARPRAPSAPVDPNAPPRRRGRPPKNAQPVVTEAPAADPAPVQGQAEQPAAFPDAAAEEAFRQEYGDSGADAGDPEPSSVPDEPVVPEAGTDQPDGASDAAQDRPVAGDEAIPGVRLPTPEEVPPARGRRRKASDAQDDAGSFL